MSVGPVDIHRVAKSLTEGEDEACWRSALSRAYYAAFHACESWHAQMELPGSVGVDGGSHKRLINQLRNPAPGTESELAKKSKLLAARLDALRVRRKVADYELSKSVDQAEARSILSTSGDILQKTAAFP